MEAERALHHIGAGVAPAFLRAGHVLDGDAPLRVVDEQRVDPRDEDPGSPAPQRVVVAPGDLDDELLRNARRPDVTDELGHPVVLEHDVFPGEPQYRPSATNELVVAAAVRGESSTVTVPLEAVRLDDDPTVDVGEVDLDVPGAGHDPNLRGEGRHPRRDQ
jgi:hypothetical protein